MEIRERASSEEKRLELERRLQHRERIATIGTLAGGVAHEFNNIMTPILLYSQVALDEVPAGSAVAGDLTRIITAAHRARSLVTRILTFSREMDSQAPTVFMLRPPVEEALALVRAIMPANIEIEIEAHDDSVPVRGDPSLVHQIVINLCTNAYQAMRGSGGRLCGAPRCHGRSGPDRRPGPLRAAGSQRYRTRHGGGGDGAYLRAVLHHPRSRRGHRTRPVSRARHRDFDGRQHQRGIRAGRRHDFQRLSAGSYRAAHRADAAASRRCRRGLNNMAAILVVDDEVEVGEAIRRVLTRPDSWSPWSAAPTRGCAPSTRARRILSLPT